MQSGTDAAVMLHKNPFVHNKLLHFGNSEGHPKTLYRRCGICTAQPCFSFFSHTTFLLLRGFSLVAVVMEECHISLWLSLWGLHSVSSNLSNCIFRLPSSSFFFSFLIKLTNNKRAGADRKSMRLGQLCGLRRRPDTNAFYAQDDEAKWAPSHGRQVKQKSLWAIGLAGLKRNPVQQRRQPPLCNSSRQTKDWCYLIKRAASISSTQTSPTTQKVG